MSVLFQVSKVTYLLPVFEGEGINGDRCEEHGHRQEPLVHALVSEELQAQLLLGYNLPHVLGLHHYHLDGKLVIEKCVKGMLQLSMWGLLHIETKHLIELGFSQVNVLLRLFLHAAESNPDHAFGTLPIDFLKSFALLYLYEKLRGILRRSQCGWYLLGTKMGPTRLNFLLKHVSHSCEIAVLVIAILCGRQIRVHIFQELRVTCHEKFVIPEFDIEDLVITVSLTAAGEDCTHDY